MVQSQAEKERLFKAGWFFAHKENGKIVTDLDEWKMWFGS